MQQTCRSTGIEYTVFPIISLRILILLYYYYYYNLIGQCYRGTKAAAKWTLLCQSDCLRVLSWSPILSEWQALVSNIKLTTETKHQRYYWDRASTLLLRPSVKLKLLLRPSEATTETECQRYCWRTERQHYCWDRASTLTTDLEQSWVPDFLTVVSQFELVSELIWLVTVSLLYTRFLFLSETQGRSTLSVPFSAEGKKAGSRCTWWLQAKYKPFAIN